MLNDREKNHRGYLELKEKKGSRDLLNALSIDQTAERINKIKASFFIPLYEMPYN